MAAEAVAGVGGRSSRRGEGPGTSRRGGGRRPVRRRPGRPGRARRRARDRLSRRDPLVPRPVAGGHPRPARARRPARPAGDAHPGRVPGVAGPPVLARFGKEGACASGWPGGPRGSCPASASCSPAASPRDLPGGPPPPWGAARWGSGGTRPMPMPGPVGPWPVSRSCSARSRGQGPAPGRPGAGQRARFVPWTGSGRNRARTAPAPTAPGHPGRGAVAGAGPPTGARRGPRPAPPTQLTDAAGRPVGVTGSGMATTVPARLSVAGGAWVEVVGWAGPWPSDERWWSVRARRRQARMQVVTATHRPPAHAGAGAGGWKRPTTDGRAHDRPLRGAPLPFQLQLPRRRLAPRGARRRGGAARPRRARPHRPRRPATGWSVSPRRPGPSAWRRSSAPSSPSAVGGAAARAGSPIPWATHLVVLARDPEGYARLCAAPSPRPSSPGGRRAGPTCTLEDSRRGARPRRALVVLTGCRKGRCPGALADARPGRGRPGSSTGWSRPSAATTWSSSSSTTATRSTRPATTPSSELAVARRRRHRGHHQRPLRHAGPAPAGRPRWPRCGPVAALDEIDGWLPAAAGAHLRSGAEQARRFARYPGRGRAGGRARAGRAPSTCSLVAPGCRPSRCPTGDDEMRLPASARPRRAPRRRYGPGATRRVAGGLGADRPRARGHRDARLSRLLPRRLGHRRVLPAPRTSSARAGARRPTRRSAYALGHHQRRRRRARAAVRALPVARARRAARHRHRHRVGPARGGDPVRLRPLRPRARRPGGQRHHLPPPLGGPRRRQGARLRRRAASTPGRKARSTPRSGIARTGGAGRPTTDPRAGAATLPASMRGLPPPSRHPLRAAW